MGKFDRHFFERAEQICGLELSLTGALGFRTIYQVNFLFRIIVLTTNRVAVTQ